MISSYLKDFWVKTSLYIGLAIDLVLFLLLYLFSRQSSLPATLHYNVYWGVDYLGEANQLLLLPLIGFIILVFNAFIGLFLWHRNKVLTYFFVAVALVSQVFIVISSAALYLINR